MRMSNEKNSVFRDEFLFKVQKAAAEPPWNMHNPPVVRMHTESPSAVKLLWLLP